MKLLEPQGYTASHFKYLINDKLDFKKECYSTFQLFYLHSKYPHYTL